MEKLERGGDAKLLDEKNYIQPAGFKRRAPRGLGGKGRGPFNSGLSPSSEREKRSRVRVGEADVTFFQGVV